MQYTTIRELRVSFEATPLLLLPLYLKPYNFNKVVFQPFDAENHMFLGTKITWNKDHDVEVLGYHIIISISCHCLQIISIFPFSTKTRILTMSMADVRNV